MKMMCTIRAHSLSRSAFFRKTAGKNNDSHLLMAGASGQGKIWGDHTYFSAELV